MEERHKALLIRQNPWWKEEKPEIPEFERDLLDTVMKHVDYKQIIGIVGLRRVGKTVIIMQVISKLLGNNMPKNNICYISFDDIDFQKYETAEEIIKYFLEFSDTSKKRYLFLDEVQKLPNWSDILKVYYDIEKNLKIFVSCSASLDIKKSKETLAGRIITFHLPVLAFSEFARYFRAKHEVASQELIRVYDIDLAPKKDRYKELFDSYMTRGAFPELLDVENEKFIKKYIRESIVEKSISDIARITGENEKTIYELFMVLAGSNAQLFELTNIANTLKISRNLAARYISMLEKSFLIRISYNFTSSTAKQARSSKKQHCAHSSIVLAILDYPFDLIRTEVSGHLVESIVANIPEKSCFWRSPQKDEVDVVVCRKDILPIEVKYKTSIANDDIKPILKFCRRFKAGRGVIVTKDMLEKRVIGGTEILFVPAWLFLLTTGFV